MENKTANINEEKIEKIKVTHATIIVEGTADKPYFSIAYQEVGKHYGNVGFGSYNLKYVFEWRDKYLEVVNQ